MSDTVHKYDWLTAYFVYNNAFYAIDEIIKDKGILDSDYFTMQHQTNYLFNLIEQLPPDDRVKIIIINLDYNILKKKIVFTLVEKNANALKIKKTFIPKPGAMTSVLSIKDVLDTIKETYDFQKICITTFGHGSLFGINATSTKLQEDINNYENHKDFKKLNEFNKFVNDNPNYFKKSYTHRTINLFILQHILQYVMNKLKEENPNKNLQGKYNLLKKGIENLALHLDNKKKYKSFLLERMLKKAYPIIIKYLPTADEHFEKSKEIKILTNREFSEGIAQSTIKKVNVLVMYNCLMQNIYTQYEFRDTVDYLVAPVGGIGFPGYDYEGVYKNLIDNISITPKDLANTYISTLGTGTLQKMEPFKQNFKDRLFATSVEINKTRLENLKVCYDKWLLAYEQLSLESPYYKLIKDNPIKKLLVNPDKQLLKIVSDTISTCFNLSSKCVTVLSVVDFFVFINSFLYLLETKNTLLENKDNLVKCSKDLIKAFSSFSQVTNGPMPEFYDNATKVSFEDKNYQEKHSQKLGIGIILNKYKDDNLKFYEPYFGLNRSIPEAIIPSFLLGTKTGELLFKN